MPAQGPFALDRDLDRRHDRVDVRKRNIGEISGFGEREGDDAHRRARIGIEERHAQLFDNRRARQIGEAGPIDVHPIDVHSGVDET